MAGCGTYIGDEAHPGIVFDYTTTHARDGPATFLKDFAGFLQADAYGAYDGIYTGSNGKIVEVGCWAHARNKFSEADSTDPERVLAAKAWVRKLYDVEDEANEIIAAQKLKGAAAAAVRLRLRQEKSVPLLTSLCQWLVAQKEQVLPKSPIAAAINYVLNQWEALNRYTTDGELHIDNNVSERTLKLIGMGRINWLFLGSDKGGATAAVLFSFTATCKHLRVDTFAYLRDVFERLPTHAVADLEELLPHRWQASRQAASSAAPAAATAGSSAIELTLPPSHAPAVPTNPATLPPRASSKSRHRDLPSQNCIASRLNIAQANLHQRLFLSKRRAFPRRLPTRGSGLAICAGPNCSRSCSQIEAVWILVRWMAVCQIAENFGEEERPGPSSVAKRQEVRARKCAEPNSGRAFLKSNMYEFRRSGHFTELLRILENAGATGLAHLPGACGS